MHESINFQNFRNLKTLDSKFIFKKKNLWNYPDTSHPNKPWKFISYLSKSLILWRNRKETSPKSQVFTLYRHIITVLYYTCFYIDLNCIFWRVFFTPAPFTLYIYFLIVSILNLYLVHNFLNFAMSTFYFILYLTMSILYLFIYSSGCYPGWQR